MKNEIFEKISVRLASLGFSNFKLEEDHLSFNTPLKNEDSSSISISLDLGKLPKKLQENILDKVISDMCTTIINECQKTGKLNK